MDFLSYLIAAARSDELVALVSTSLQMRLFLVCEPHCNPPPQPPGLVSELCSMRVWQVLAAEPEQGKRFVTMKARPVLKDEDIEGVATMEVPCARDSRVSVCVCSACVAQRRHDVHS